MNINLISLAFAAAASIALALSVYQRTSDRVWNRLFAVHGTVIGVWALANFLIMSSSTATEAGFYLRLSHPLAALVACTMIDFAWVFPERIEPAPITRRLMLYAAGVSFGALGFAPDLYDSISLSDGLVNVQYGWPLVPFGAFIVLSMTYADVVILLKAFRLDGVQRQQAIWVLVGFAGTHLVGMFTIIIIPLVWGTTAYSGWGAAGALCQLVGMGYAIVKHQLLPVGLALRRVGAALASAIIVLLIGAIMLYLFVPMSTVVEHSSAPPYIGIGLVLGLLLVIIYDRGTHLMSRLLSSSAGDSESVQAETASHILRTLDAEQLLDYLAGALDDALEPQRVVIYTGESGDEALRPRAWRRSSHGERSNGERWEPEPISARDPLVVHAAREASLLSRDRVFRFTALPEARRVAAAMDDLGVEIVAPMIWEEQLIGLVTLGYKRSGEMYKDTDVPFVAEMALQASLALRNADLYAQTATLKEFNERILRQMDNAVIVTDDQERIVVFNEAAERLLGMDIDEAIGSSIEIIPPGIAECVRASLRTGEVLSGRHIELERDGRGIPVACSASPLEGEGEWARGAVAVISDLTLIRELDRERQEAERLALIRVISAGMAHEIRNPLVAIRTFAELAPSRLDDPEFRSNFLTVAQAEIKRIDSLVGDLLTLSKPADAVVEPIDVERICREVVRATSGMAEARGIEMLLELEEIDGCPSGDETRLHQALLNIITNAIDAEPPNGRVALTVSQESRQESRDRVMIHVRNPGSFIPEEQIEEIFRPFVSKKAHGTGLGLAICQTIIEEHNGDVRVESTPEDGTQFTVELPLSASRAVTRAGDQ